MNKISVTDLPDSFNAGERLRLPSEQPQPEQVVSIRKPIPAPVELKPIEVKPIRTKKTKREKHVSKPKPAPPTENQQTGWQHWDRKQAAAYLKVTPQAFDLYVKAGLIKPVHSTGGRYSRPRFLIQDVMSFKKPKPGRPWHKEKGREYDISKPKPE